MAKASKKHSHFKKSQTSTGDLITNKPALQKVDEEMEKPALAIGSHGRASINQKPKWKSIGFFMNAYYFGITVLLFATDVVSKFKDATSTDYERFRNSSTISGLIIPKDIADTIQYLHVVRGKFDETVSVAELRTVPSVRVDDLIPISTGTPYVDLNMVGNKIFVSKDLYDLDHHYLGRINKEKWEIHKKFVSDYFETDSSIEVVDDYNVVVFSMRYRPPNQVIIYGYDLGPNYLYLHSDTRDVIMANIPSLSDSTKIIGQLIPRTTGRPDNGHTWYFVVFLTLLVIPWAYYIWVKYLDPERKLKEYIN